MGERVKAYSEVVLTVLTIFILLLTVMLYREDLQGTYTILLFGSVAMYMFTWVINRQGLITLNGQSGNTIKQVFTAGAVFIGFAAVALLVGGVFGQIVEGDGLARLLNSVTIPFSTENTPGYAPLLANLPLLTFFVFTFLIPFIETQAIARLLNFFTTAFKIPTELKISNYQLWAAFAFVSGIFVWLHVRVRGLGAGVDFAHILTFLFAMASCFMIIKSREFEGAWHFHSLWNGAIMIKRLGWF